MTVTTDAIDVAQQTAQSIRVRPAPARPRPKQQPRYNVVLLDDDDHTYDYVIDMLKAVFGYPIERGFQMACEVDSTGRVILLTTTLEHAELKRDQVHGFGADKLLERSRGSMTAVLEPVE